MIQINCKIYFINFISIILLCSGCLKNEVSISFDLPQEADDTYQITYYASDSRRGMFLENIILLEKGKAETRCAAKNPMIMFLSRGNSEPELAFYAERGDDIEILGTNNNLYEWKITGNDINKEWSDWRIKNKEALTNRNAQKINDAVAEFVKQHPSNPLSTLLLLIHYNRGINPKGFQKAWNLLKDKALEPKWSNLISRNDFTDGRPFFSSNKITQIITASYYNEADTINFIGKGGIVLFRQDCSYGTPELNAIKALAKEYPDSSKRIIADISFSPDSINWAMNIRSDSIRNVIRGWNPLALTDSAISRIGIQKTPTFLVISKKGELLFMGNEISKATNIFRQLNKNN